MKISAKTDYACKALLELALHWPNTTPLRQNIISEKRNIPMKFLAQILIQLKQLGYVNSMRGKMGGYLLSKPPQQILFSDILRDMAELQWASNTRRTQKNDIFEIVWRELDEVWLEYMKQINFDTLRQRERNVALYTI
jgi:Rrf2 family protein